jgi:glycosyltransferase involved in cell wall biosynthesis
MKIFLTIDVYDPARGGASEWVKQLASWLQPRGYKVVIVCERADAQAPTGCEILCPATSDSSPSPWKRASRLQKLVASQTRGLVHDTGYLLESDIFHPLMGSRVHNEIRQMMAFPLSRALTHLRYSKLWQVARLQWRQLRRSRHLVACSQRVQADFTQWGRPAHSLIRNGIELSTERPAASLAELRSRLGASERTLILLTSNNHFLKGVPSLLRALTLLEPALRSRLKVVVAGHCRDDDFQSFIDRHGLGDCCALVGWIEDVDAYYQTADIFFHPTYHDAGSLSTLKALAAGCAVATSRWDGSSEVIRHGQEGLILERPGDSHELAAALKRLLDPELRACLGSRARMLRPQLSQELCFERVESLYRTFPC